ncbi:hypothetical protein DFR39_109186 [Roseateles asaccharophilus]|uniref:Uncharacterized protein n=1 Tax=Roseateles asaccharophilus TaxID=582607 RepID=A0A4R6MWB9_9BURK|nr:hypothetical protein DFR39_109186 [Roseateles asaccharophilus]
MHRQHEAEHLGPIPNADRMRQRCALESGPQFGCKPQPLLSKLRPQEK